MNLHRLRQWFAWPDAVRSPWKRRLVWGVLFVLVLAGVVVWRATRPTLEEDVELVDVSREEAVVIFGELRRTKNRMAFSYLKDWDFGNAYEKARPEKLLRIKLHSNYLAAVKTSWSPSNGGFYEFIHKTDGWRLKSVGQWWENKRTGTNQ